MIKKYVMVIVGMMAALMGMAQSNLPFTNKELEYQIKADEIEMPGRRIRYTVTPETLQKPQAGKPPVTTQQPDGSNKITSYYPSGKLKEETYFINGKKNGVSIAYYENGNVQQRVPYKDDFIEGEKIYNAENGELVVRTVYRKGKREGNRSIYYNSGIDPAKRIFAVTPYKNDLIDGVVTMYKLEAQEYFLRYKASFRSGLPDGIWETFERGYLPASTDGKYMKPVVYKKTEEWNSQGKRTGIKKDFRPDGTVKTATVFFADTIQYIESFDVKGKSLYKNRYEHGKGTGIHQYFHDNGQLRIKFNMEAGKRSGEALSYYENGQLEEKAEYQDDHQVGPFVKYYQNGNKEKEGTTGKGYLPAGSVVEYFQEGGVRATSEYNEQGQLLKQAYYDRYSKKKKVVSLYENGGEVATEYYDSSSNLIWTNHFLNGKKIGLYKHYDYRDRLATQSYEIDNKTGYVFQYNEFNGKVMSERYTINGTTVTKEIFLNKYNINNDIVTAKTGN